MEARVFLMVLKLVTSEKVTRWSAGYLVSRGQLWRVIERAGWLLTDPQPTTDAQTASPPTHSQYKKIKYVSTHSGGKYDFLTFL